MPQSFTRKMDSPVKGYDHYEVKSAVDTLKRAEEIKNDPAFMSAVEEEARRQADALRSIAKEKPVQRTRGGV